MATEQQRHDLHTRLGVLLTPELAGVLMESLPNRDWHDLATRDDLAGLAQRLDRMDVRFDGIDRRFDQVDQRFDQVDQRFDQVDQRFDRIDERFAKVDGRLTGMERQLDALEIRFDGLGDRFEGLEHRILGEFRHEIINQNRLLFFSGLGAIFTTASLAFAAVRL